MVTTFTETLIGTDAILDARVSVVRVYYYRTSLFRSHDVKQEMFVFVCRGKFCEYMSLHLLQFVYRQSIGNQSSREIFATSTFAVVKKLPKMLKLDECTKFLLYNIEVMQQYFTYGRPFP